MQYKKKLLKPATLTFLFSYSLLGAAATLDFENFATGGNVRFTPEYREDGYRFNPGASIPLPGLPPSPSAISIFPKVTSFGSNSSGSAYLGVLGMSPSAVLSENTGKNFSLTSLDVGSIQSPQDFNIVGNYSRGGTVTYQVRGAGSFQNITLSRFTNLSSVSFENVNQARSLAIDNLKVSTTPSASSKVYGLSVGLTTPSSAAQPGFVDGASDARNVFSALKSAAGTSWASGALGNSSQSLSLSESTTNGYAQIKSALDAMQVKAGDTFVFYFSGHGQSFASVGGRDETPVSDVEKYPSGPNTNDETIQLGKLYNPSTGEGFYISDDELTMLFKSDPKWEGVKKIFMIDACYAGGFWGDGSSSDAGDLNQLDNAVLFAAASEDARARTVGDGSGLGLWTEKALLPALSSASLTGSMSSFSSQIQKNMDDWNLVGARDIDGVFFSKDGIYDPIEGPATLSGSFFVGNDFDLDAGIVYAPVPEPEVYAMLGLGLGFLGWVARRKQA